MIKPVDWCANVSKSSPTCDKVGRKETLEFSFLENILEALTLLLQIVTGGELEWKTCSRHWILSIVSGPRVENYCLLLVMQNINIDYRNTIGSADTADTTLPLSPPPDIDIDDVLMS